jgi:hypothetical protein
MDTTSPFLAIQRAEAQLKSLIRTIDVDVLAVDEKKALASLRRLIVEARLDVRDYELSETREEQLKCALTAKRHIGRVQKDILAVGPSLGAADVAQLTAQLEQIASWIR